MAVSEKQLEANRRNALKSTGPRTQRGKDRSRENALKHGLSADTLVYRAIRHEDPKRFRSMRDETIHSWKPVGAREVQICEMIANAFCRIQRAENFESSFFTGAMQRAERKHRDPSLKKNDDLGCGIVLGKAEHELSWENIDRYRRHAWLDYNRAVSLLEKMQKQRIELRNAEQDADGDEDQDHTARPEPTEAAANPAQITETQQQPVEMASFRPNPSTPAVTPANQAPAPPFTASEPPPAVPIVVPDAA